MEIKFKKIMERKKPAGKRGTKAIARLNVVVGHWFLFLFSGKNT
jgi:hypothetical protein